MNCTAAHLWSRSLNIVSLSDVIEGSYGSWDLYTIGQLVDGLQKKKKRKPVFIKRKWNHVVFSRATILSFYPVCLPNPSDRGSIFDRKKTGLNQFFFFCRMVGLFCYLHIARSREGWIHVFPNVFKPRETQTGVFITWPRIADSIFSNDNYFCSDL